MVRLSSVPLNQQKWFPNPMFQGLQTVEDTLVEALVTLENDKRKVQSITGYDWIISLFKRKCVQDGDKISLSWEGGLR